MEKLGRPPRCRPGLLGFGDQADRWIVTYGAADRCCPGVTYLGSRRTTVVLRPQVFRVLVGRKILWPPSDKPDGMLERTARRWAFENWPDDPLSGNFYPIRFPKEHDLTAKRASEEHPGLPGPPKVPSARRQRSVF